VVEKKNNDSIKDIIMTKIIILFILCWLTVVICTDPIEKYGRPRSHYQNVTNSVEYRNKCMYTTHIERLEKRLSASSVIINFHSKTYLDVKTHNGDEHYWTVNTKTNDVTFYRSTGYKLVSDPFDLLGKDLVHLNAQLWDLKYEGGIGVAYNLEAKFTFNCGWTAGNCCISNANYIPSMGVMNRQTTECEKVKGA
jgi:hypothetical protein